jgi:hypothetical protein
MHDEQIVLDVKKQARIILPKQPQNNYVNGIHLAITLDKALAAIHTGDPFSTQELSIRYFQRDLARTGLHEISGIREEVNTLLLLKTQDKAYIESRLKTGIDLAATYKFSRHKRHLSQLLRELASKVL